MARPLLIPNPENATIEELKQVSRVGSNETATRCTAIQMLLAGANRELVCNALFVTHRAIRTVVRFFHKQGDALKTSQPWPDKQDEQLRETFLQELKQQMHRPDVDIWFADESGFEGDPGPRKRWDKKGRKTRVTKNGGHLRMNVIGMVCPRSGQFFAIEASHSDSATFQAFLDEANKTVSFQRTTNILIVDNATWHRRKDTHWYRWQPKYLPPYSPDLNPIERIWLTMKARWFNNYVCKNEEQ